VVSKSIGSSAYVLRDISLTQYGRACGFPVRIPMHIPSIEDSDFRPSACFSDHAKPPDTSTRSVNLTEAGERLLARIVPALRDVDEAIASLQGTGTVLTGRLRINAPPAAIDLVLAPIVIAFLAQHPGVTIEIMAESSLIDIVAGGFDAGVRYEETLGQDMVSVDRRRQH
jgi:hypothetical protein